MENKKTMTIREVQLASLEILKKIDFLCSELNIQYFLIHGSLLGAIRHKGFIPWDDDLDIAMKIDDYNTFLEYCKNNSNLGSLEIHNFENNKDCFYNITRVCDTKYLLEFENSNYTSGVFVDIYPFEGLGDKANLQYWNHRFRKNMRLQKHLTFCCSKSLLCGASTLTKILHIPNLIISKIIGKQYFIKRLKDYPKIPISESEFIGIPSWEFFIYRREWFDEIIKVPFENAQVFVPKEYDSVLKYTFGDYMQLPPEKDRNPHHGFIAYKK